MREDIEIRKRGSIEIETPFLNSILVSSLSNINNGDI